MPPPWRRKLDATRLPASITPMALPSYPSARRFSKILGAMEPFRVLEHTADVGFEAFGSTREEVFANAARALMNIIVDLDSVDPATDVPVQAEGSGPSDLLVNWLSEILYLFDADGWVFSQLDVRNLTDHAISAVARGEKFDPARHQVNLLVKAVTYHQLALEKTADGWRAQVYVDI